jgi:hypothetical protein
MRDRCANTTANQTEAPPSHAYPPTKYKSTSWIRFITKHERLYPVETVATNLVFLSVEDNRAEQNETNTHHSLQNWRLAILTTEERFE